MKAFLWMIALLVMGIPVLCQDAAKKIPAAPSIAVLARAQKNKILLRWAVNQPAAWQYANQYGFVVERYTIVRNNQVLRQPEKHLLTEQPLRPQPLPVWETAAQQDNYAAVIAQCIYGDTPASVAGSNIAAVTQAADKLSQRFYFSLLAADRSFAAARMAGWGWIDSTVHQNEKYLYRVYTAIPSTQLKTDTSGVVTSLKDNAVLPAPKDFYASFGNRTASLSWDERLLQETYAGYFVERSTDGSIFIKVSDLPVTNMRQQGEKPTGRVSYIDSLSANGKTYFYRVYGVTCFGETGPVSAIVQGAGKEVFTARPRIKNAVVTAKGAELEWEIEEAGSIAVDHFELNHSGKPNGAYTTVSKIENKKRSTTYRHLLPSNYFTVTAVAKNGTKITSPPYLLQPVDSLPPAAPSGVIAAIDTSGRVTLRWDANKENDLMGYQVFRANLPNEQPAVLTKYVFNLTVYRDTVNLRSLNEDVYYSVVALDDHYNQSAFSVKIKVSKPDKVPPAPPVMLGASLTRQNQVQVNWRNSNSADITMHKLFRKNYTAEETMWSMVKEYTGTADTTFRDKEVSGGNTYAYLLIAVDDGGNETAARIPATINIPMQMIKPRVKDLSADVNRNAKRIDVTWRYEEPGVLEQQVFKSSNGGQLTLWKIIPATQKSVEDSELSPGNTYTYAVRAVFRDGSYSSWTETRTTY